MNTFFRAAFDEWDHAYDCFFDGNKYRLQEIPSLRKTAPSSRPRGGAGIRRRPSSLFLLLGYLKQLLAQIGHVWKVRKQLQGRIIVLNEFGCEVMPIAYRLCLPKAVILAIVHTHPGQGPAAQNWVRCLVERICYRSVSDLVFNSAATMELWQRKLGLDQIRGRVIWYGMDGATPDVPTDYPEKPPGCVDFVYLAQFYGWKGQLSFLHVWKDVVGRVPQKVRVVMIGDGIGLPDCRQYVEENGLSESVVFLGQRPNGSAYLPGGDALIHMPLEPEAFGQVLVEAMRCALPVIASRLGGIQEVVEHEKTGFLVDPTNADLVEETVMTLAQDSHLRDEMGRQGQKRWETEFTRKHMLDRYDRLFSELSQGAG